MQQLLVIVIVGMCGVWLGFQVFRYLRPRPGGKACAGGCCDGPAEKPARAEQAAPRERTMMISSDDLRARLAARKK